MFLQIVIFPLKKKKRFFSASKQQLGVPAQHVCLVGMGLGFLHNQHLVNIALYI
jgi:hypothetical protein